MIRSGNTETCRKRVADERTAIPSAGSEIAGRIAPCKDFPFGVCGLEGFPGEGCPSSSRNMRSLTRFAHVSLFRRGGMTGTGWKGNARTWMRGRSTSGEPGSIQRLRTGVGPGRSFASRAHRSRADGADGNGSRWWELSIRGAIRDASPGAKSGERGAGIPETGPFAPFRRRHPLQPSGEGGVSGTGDVDHASDLAESPVHAAAIPDVQSIEFRGRHEPHSGRGAATGGDSIAVRTRGGSPGGSP